MTRSRDLADLGDYVVNVNSSSTAFEIRQLGSGNAFRVEDATNPDSTPFIIDASGNVGIGLTTPTQKLDVSGTTRFVSGNEWPVRAESSLTTLGHRNNFLTQRSVGGAAVTTGTNLGGLGMAGFDGTNFSFGWNGGAEIMAYASQNWTSTNKGTYLSIFTTANNTAGSLERFRIEENGNTLLVNQPVDTLRYFDIYNASSGANAGTIIRLITNNNANTATTTVDLVKYRTGAFVISNNDTVGTIVFSTAGTGAAEITAAGQLRILRDSTATVSSVLLDGSTRNHLAFNSNGVAAPAFTTRSAGTKIVLYPNVGAAAVDFAFGIEGSSLWSSVPTTGDYFKWYGGTTQLGYWRGTEGLILSGARPNNTTSFQVRNIYISTSDPTGGSDGDVWIKYTA